MSPAPSNEAPVSRADVEAAADVIASVAVRTPVMTSRLLDARTGGSVFLKCENFQRTGSFKFRGAFHAISRLSEVERCRGIITYSSGNHAQAVARVGQILGASITVVMPTDAPETKRSATAAYGAEIVLYDPKRQRRESVAARLMTERGLTLIPPFDHRDVLTGQGTAALELIEEVGELDLLLVPCGGGGLLAGSSIAVSMLPRCRVVGVEPELADDANRTFRSGVLNRTENSRTIADGLRTPSLGRLTWPIIRSNVAEMRTVSETDIIGAMRFLWSHMKLVVEPSGAVALAAALAKPSLSGGLRVGVIVSGGNVDLDRACALFS
jgi:threo-3-hydroxy-L-aspartate ammonia-lyase